MNPSAVLQILMARWPVFLASLALVGVGVAPLCLAEPVYHSQVDMALVSPGKSVLDSIDGDREELIPLAALVEREMNEGLPVTRLSSSGATLFGAGVRQGYSVVLPNYGGQWSNNFSRAVLSVEVVDSDPERVRDVMSAVLSSVEEVTERLQSDEGVHLDDQVTVVSLPDVPTVSQVGGTAAGRARAFLAVSPLAVGVAVAATVAVDRLKKRGGRASAVPFARAVP